MLASVPRMWFSGEVAIAHQRSVSQAYAAAIEDPSNVEERANFSPYPDFAEAHAYLQTHQMGLADREVVPEGSLAPVGASITQLKVDGYRLSLSDRCTGHLDWVKLGSGNADTVDAGGWAWMPAISGPRRIVLALDDGTVVGTARIRHPRPDVRKRNPSVNELNTGWAARVSLPRGRTLRAFVVSDDSESACILPDEFRSQ